MSLVAAVAIDASAVARRRICAVCTASGTQRYARSFLHSKAGRGCGGIARWSEGGSLPCVVNIHASRMRLSYTVYRGINVCVETRDRRMSSKAAGQHGRVGGDQTLSLLHRKATSPGGVGSFCRVGGLGGAASSSGKHGGSVGGVGCAVSSNSVFDRQLEQCIDAAAILRAAATSNLPFGHSDLKAFFERLRTTGSFPKTGSDLRRFVGKVNECLTKSESQSAGNLVGSVVGQRFGARVTDLTAESARLAVVEFAILTCRSGVLVAWPFLVKRLNVLSPKDLSDSMWALSKVSNPTTDVFVGIVDAANMLAPRLSELSDPRFLYRAVYGIARVRRGKKCEEFRRHAERSIVHWLQQQGPCPFGPSQLVRLCWGIARLGSQDASVYRAFEPRLRAVVLELSDAELDALYGIFTDLERVEQRRLIHDIEMVLEQREDSRDPHKQKRKKPFTSKWTRVSISDSVLPRQRQPRQPKAGLAGQVGALSDARP
eukprot:TRINITY_DN68488_c0_g1_i1.p1 TRINITY_DN68488_c0_g1~~TRINITY_DN68488_c0_g1_i1.p1  ORF type:complete len:487 (+),score=47.72 TRINITY_DN68488_c0_g1_i1:59-1519(+)